MAGRTGQNIQRHSRRNRRECGGAVLRVRGPPTAKSALAGAGESGPRATRRGRRMREAPAPSRLMKRYRRKKETTARRSRGATAKTRLSGFFARAERAPTRCRPELNRCTGFCRPLRNHSATAPERRERARSQSQVYRSMLRGNYTGSLSSASSPRRESGVHRDDAGGGVRTHMAVAHRGILSPLRLPVSPPRHILSVTAQPGDDTITVAALEGAELGGSLGTKPEMMSTSAVRVLLSSPTGTRAFSR